MKTIWKYPLTTETRCIIGMPEGAEILTIQVQNNVPCVWAEVDTEAELEERVFCFFATGEEIGFDGQEYDYLYVGTVQLYNGASVLHVFEL